MHDLLSQTKSHARGMWRYRWRALIVSWVLCVVGWSLVYGLPNVYEVETRVFVDTDSVLRPLLRGLTTESNVMNQVNMMTRAMLSRPHLEEVARETDLDLRANTPRQMEKLIEKLRATIEIRAARDQLYTITFQDQDPRMAHAVVQTLLSNFVGDTLQTNRNDSTVALRFLQEQIAEHEARLDESERKLAEFKKKNVGLMPDANGGYYERLQNASSSLGRLQSQLNLALRTRQELLRQLEGEEPVFGLGGGAVVTAYTELDEKIAGIEDRLADLRLSFTDKHPDIVALVDTLERLESQRADERLSVADSRREVNPLDMNPVYQTMKIELNQTEVEIARHNTQIAQQRAAVAQLQRSVDTIPEIEADLSRLTRDYEVTKVRYEDLLERLESARLTETAEQSSQDVKFRVIDPPTVPLEPIGPNRVLFLTIVMLFSLAAGAAFAFLLDQLNPVFHSRQELKKITGLPVLGSVSVALAPRQVVAQRLQVSAFMLGLSLLCVVYTAAVWLRGPAVELATRLVGSVSA